MINKDSKYMSPVEAWKEKFQLSTSCTLEEALKNQLVSEIEYQEWASKYYSLPVIEDTFFEKNPLDESFLDKIKSIAKLSAIPCFEWNNILYVACLEPQEIDTNQKTVFFITSLKSMESLWNNIQTSVKEPEIIIKEKQLSPPKETTVHNTEPKQKINNNDIEFQYVSKSKSFILSIVDFIKSFFIAPKKISKPKRKLHKAAGHRNNIKTTSHKNNKDQIAAIQKTKEEKEPMPIALETENKPSPDTQKPSPTKEEKEPMPITLETENKPSPDTQKPSPKKEEKEPMPIALETENKPSPDTQKPSPTKEEVPISMASLGTTDNPSSIKTPSTSSEKEDIPITPPIALKTKEENINTPPLAAANHSLEQKEESKLESESQDSTHSISSSFLILDKKKITALDQLNPLRRPLEETKHYVNSYILFVFKKDSFIPYKWSSNLKAQKNVPGVIQKPSIFRIVYTSKQAYFGHLAPVLANNSFFNQWGFTTFPKHVLLIPFLDIHKQKILGAYLGISETRTLPIKCLGAIERIIQPLSAYYEDGSLLKKVS